MMTDMEPTSQDIGLLNKAIESINSVSSSLMQYYQALEQKVGLLTDEVEQKKQLLNSIIESIDIGVVFFDGSGRIMLVNRAAEELLRVESGSLIGSKDMGARIGDGVIMLGGGGSFDALVSQADVRSGDGIVLGRVIIFKDITRLKQLEAENERNRRLSAMGELVMKIAHEIRNPLGSIELFANLLVTDLRGTEQVEYARRISKGVRSLVNTLDNMLRFSGELRPRMEYTMLRDLVSQLCDEFIEILSGSGVELDLSADDTLGLYLDRGLMRQALLNILLNAVQAMPEGGTIGIRVEHGDGDCALLRVKDNGPGMGEETKARLFEPFFSTKDRGTGLGLSITMGIIAAHQGSITVESAPGSGTEFIIELPLDKRKKDR